MTLSCGPKWAQSRTKGRRAVRSVAQSPEALSIKLCCLIIRDLNSDPTYAEAQFDMFGKRVIGAHIGRHDNATNFVRPPRFDRLLTDLRTRQIHSKNGPMAQRLYEQLHSLEVELRESKDAVAACRNHPAARGLVATISMGIGAR
jgi:hypothetical protein